MKETNEAPQKPPFQTEEETPNNSSEEKDQLTDDDLDSVSGGVLRRRFREGEEEPMQP